MGAGRLTDAAELDRLAAGPRPGEPPPEPPLAISAPCPGGAGQVLARVREVLRPVLEAPQPWPETDAWRRRLPAWFVEACSDDERVTTCVVDRWSLRAWVWWFQPEQRRWLWWDAEAEGDELTIQVLPTGQGSMLLGTLEWLLKAAGAKPR